MARVFEQMTLQRPVIQNIKLDTTDWTKVTLSLGEKTKHVKVQCVENEAIRISFVSDGATYFTIKGGTVFEIDSNMYGATDSHCFWLNAITATRNVEVIESK